MALLIFNDCETTGLDFFEDEVWQIHFVAAHTGETRATDSFTRLITHDTNKMEKLPLKFRDIHNQWWSDPNYAGLVRTPTEACGEFLEWITQGVGSGEKAHFIAANPMFDATMLMANKIIPFSMFYQIFDYHLIDIEAFALGWLRHKEVKNHEVIDPAFPYFRESFLPFKSDDLSKALYVYDEDAHKHDAISDVDWMIKMWKQMNNGKY